MDDEFMRMLQELRNQMNGPLRISSARRCSRLNETFSTTGKNGPHTQAKATDILISGERAMDIVREGSPDWLQWDRIESKGLSCQ